MGRSFIHLGRGRVRSALYELLEHPGFREDVLWETRCLPANHTVFPEGDHGREVYLILRGRVRVVGNVDLDEQRKLQPGISELTEGQMFGELPLFAGEPRSATVVTLEECELSMMDGDRLLAFLDRLPHRGYSLFKVLIQSLTGRLRQAIKRIFSLFAWGLKMRGIDQHL